MIDYMQATAEEAEKYAALAKKHGLPALKVADLSCDMPLLAEAREAAQELLRRDPQLTDGEHAPLRRRIAALFELNESALN